MRRTRALWPSHSTRATIRLIPASHQRALEALKRRHWLKRESPTPGGLCTVAALSLRAGQSPPVVSNLTSSMTSFSFSTKSVRPLAAELASLWKAEQAPILDAAHRLWSDTLVVGIRFARTGCRITSLFSLVSSIVETGSDRSGPSGSGQPVLRGRFVPPASHGNVAGGVAHVVQ
jgi:hypothetical protein